jgi:hypothetical protein
MNDSQPRVREQLFILRLWREVLNGGRAEWRGEVRYVASGEVRYFRKWSALIQFIVAMLPNVKRNEP